MPVDGIYTIHFLVKMIKTKINLISLDFSRPLVYDYHMLSNRLQEAIEFAYQNHENQKDKGGKPYFLHPLRVMLDVAHLGEDYMIVAICHDLIEDCGVTVQQLTEKFGSTVTEAVESVSRRVVPVKEPYFDLIDRAGANLIGIEVKLADIQDNMQPSRIACLPPEMQSIVHRYERAKAKLLRLKENRLSEQARKQHEAILENGGGA